MSMASKTQAPQKSGTDKTDKGDGMDKGHIAVSQSSFDIETS